MISKNKPSISYCALVYDTPRKIVSTRVFSSIMIDNLIIKGRKNSWNHENIKDNIPSIKITVIKINVKLGMPSRL
ncbi:Hypothetical protein SRAE_1000006600 [Strongyloides ratti]|uniref:Uncharacterized protein n=1 Tax=Strongyloides ratti TaxID=34506 RepID=A0A090KWB9_STRRB|nr:Hypothetical protein SRAE_1000006600 [Strongyloides ratti]CEF61790.1 Hypothetical protein SRAE_1000006600 [Strongyloides ratti]